MPSNLVAENELVMNDLGPLAWVLDELRKSLDSATKAMRRFVRDAELARGSDLTELDASQIRIARQQLHQAVGALEMVGMEAPAKVVRAMEALAQKFVQRPEQCSDDAAARLERASFALTEYLEGVLKGKLASPVALFPQYRAIMELASADRVHPADLWPAEWRWQTIELPGEIEPKSYAPALRTRMDQKVLKIVKSGDRSAAQQMARLCAEFAVGQSATESRTFWAIAAGFFEAMRLGMFPEDVYSKRTASRILQQYASLAKGNPHVTDRLAQDLVFFCSLAAPEDGTEAPLLMAVRKAYGLNNTVSVDYETAQFGRFDPALLVLARKRIAAAAETWSGLAGGDTHRLKMASEQFVAVADSMVKLHPESAALARALNGAIDMTVQSGAAPLPAIAMEVATTVLYLEAAYEDLDPTNSQMADRGERLAQRLQSVSVGGVSEPMEGWMEELYRRVSDRQTMGSVVDELRATLGEVETSLDQFFRNPADKTSLREVPSRLSQMRGVFSVLGLDQPSIAALRIRASVEQFLVDTVDVEAARSGTFEKLGNSLGAMGFLIDMLSYQRALAKKLFVYDEALGEFKSLMGRERSTAPQVETTIGVSAFAAVAPLDVAEIPRVLVAQVRVAPVEGDDDDIEMQDIFLEEAREVVQNGLASLRALASDPSNLADQTTLRRAFHTLKGSSRMVGLSEFGEAAWSFEQLLNSWLAEQRPASDDLISLSGAAMAALGRWVEDISGKNDVVWSAANFRKSADSLRHDDVMLPLQHGADQVVLESDLLDHPEFASTQMSDIPLPLFAEPNDLAGGGEAEHVENADASLKASFESTQLSDSLLSDVGYVARPDFQVTQTFDFEATRSFDGVPERLVEPLPEDFDLGDFDFGEAKSESQNVKVVDVSDPGLLGEEQVKVIGPLRLGIPLYNVYLNEADEWSRRLQTELSEWAMELHRPISDSVVTLAHSLSGCSATVGFSALSEMAKALEYALQHVQLHGQGTAEHAIVFNNAAEDIRRLLHQFAAGFLKGADGSVLEALQAIIEIEFIAPTLLVDDESLHPHALEPELPVESVLQDEVVTLMPMASEHPVVAHVPAKPAEVVSLSSLHIAAAPLNVVDATDEDIDAIDRLDEDLLPIFEEEAQELLPALGTALRQWVARPDNANARGEVLRLLHTLKGSARLAGAMRLGEMAHRMESSIEYIGSENLQAVQLDPLLSRLDVLQATFGRLGQPVSSESAAVAAQLATHAKELAVDAGPETVFLAGEVDGRTTANPKANQSVRVRSQLLDRLVNQAGEVMISRSRIESRLVQLRTSLQELDGNLDRLRQQLRDVELQAESQMQSRLAQTKDAAQGFDPLEFDRFTRVQELTRMMAESVNDVATVQRGLQRTVQGTEDDLIAQGRQARELQRDLLRTRMVEFEAISDRLYGVVRQVGKESGKQVRLDIIGGSINMDRGVLDRMAPAFEHMLRNAVAHGIETVTQRTAVGKPAVGTITITVEQQNNDVSVAFSDDGGGLHFDRIRAKAISNGLVAQDAVLSETDAANLLFMPGFSTADQVTELSGRGIGMDVVRSEVNALGGRIETATEQGKGSTFKLVLPLTTAVTQVVMLRMGEFTIGVPSSLMETVLRVPSALLDQAYVSDSFDMVSTAIPFYWSGALLQISPRSLEPRGKTSQVGVFRSAGQRLAMHVDEVLGNREVVVKNLGPQLARLPGLAGMSVLASGAVVLIYNPVALATVYGEQAIQWTKAPDVALSGLSGTDVSAAQLPLVLVVDDSITVRRVTQRLLKREGYRVVLANDGLHALEKLQEETPAVVLSDIEMPRMDGFDLLRNIRADEHMRGLPVIMITSRIAEKHREHAKALGADHYLGKPYSEDLLLELVRGYCTSPAVS